MYARWLQELKEAIATRVSPPSDEVWQLDSSESVKVLLKKRTWRAPGPETCYSLVEAGANALREDITQVFVSITKQTVVYPLWFSEGKIQLMLKPGSFSSENQRPIYNLLELDSPKGEFYRLLLLIVLHENAKFTKTDTQLPIDPDPWTSLILH